MQTLVITKVRNQARNTRSFDLRPSENIDFVPGQVGILRVEPEEPAYFAFASAPEDADLEVLRKFIGHPEIEPLQANNPEALVNYIKWVSTAVLQAASSPASQMATPAPSGAAGAMSISQSGVVAASQPISQGANVPVPLPVAASAPASAADVW